MSGMSDMNGKRGAIEGPALVTGAARRIGLAIAARLAHEGTARHSARLAALGR